jgi:hypothetical protein
VESNLGGVVKEVGDSIGIEVKGREGTVHEPSLENPFLYNSFIERTSKGQKGVGGRKTSTCKGTQCARDRKSSERLVFGDDIDMDRVVEFSEQKWSIELGGKNWVWPS